MKVQSIHSLHDLAMALPQNNMRLKDCFFSRSKFESSFRLEWCIQLCPPAIVQVNSDRSFWPGQDQGMLAQINRWLFKISHFWSCIFVMPDQQIASLEHNLPLPVLSAGITQVKNIDHPRWSRKWCRRQ